jgi:hypothetical protein
MLGHHKQTFGKCLAVTGKPLAHAWQMLGHHKQTVGKWLAVACTSRWQMLGQRKQTVGKDWLPQASR